MFASTNVISEPIGYDREYKYQRVKIISCETSEKVMLKNAELKNYSPSNKQKLLESSKYLIILEVVPLFDVEFITSVYDGNRKQFLGRVTPINNSKKIKLHMQWANCEKYEKNKEVIFSISSGYNCGNEPLPKGHQETNASCLVGYEIAHEARVGEYR